jgi:hypothetical protein
VCGGEEVSECKCDHDGLICGECGGELNVDECRKERDALRAEIARLQMELRGVHRVVEDTYEYLCQQAEWVETKRQSDMVLACAGIISYAKGKLLCALPKNEIGGNE